MADKNRPEGESFVEFWKRKSRDEASQYGAPDLANILIDGHRQKQINAKLAEPRNVATDKSNIASWIEHYKTTLDFSLGYFVGNENYKGLKDFTLHQTPSDTLTVAESRDHKNGQICVLEGDFEGCRKAIQVDYAMAKNAATSFLTFLKDPKATDQDITNVRTQLLEFHAKALTQIQTITDSIGKGAGSTPVRVSLKNGGQREENWPVLNLHYKTPEGPIASVKIAYDPLSTNINLMRNQIDELQSRLKTVLKYADQDHTKPNHAEAIRHAYRFTDAPTLEEKIAAERAAAEGAQNKR